MTTDATFSSEQAVAFLGSRRSTPPTDLGMPVPDASQLETILRLASRTPDHGRLVPYRFVVLDHDACVRMGDHVRAAYAEDHPDADESALSHSRQRFDNAPMIVAVVSRAQASHPKIPEWEQILTAGAVCMNLLHAAHALGFGAIWLTGWTTYDRRILGALGLGVDERLAGWIHLGTPGSPREDRPRPVVSEITTFWR
ncbi:MAG: nitroreductase [Planctomycetota bacterium]|nr:MAG: nitroreductase [Planctomycetota bacterium]